MYNISMSGRGAHSSSKKLPKLSYLSPTRAKRFDDHDGDDALQVDLDLNYDDDPEEDKETSTSKLLDMITTTTTTTMMLVMVVMKMTMLRKTIRN